MYLNDKEILITGGTGSLGKQLVRLLMSEYKPKGIRVFSRDELKQWQMAAEMKNAGCTNNISYLIGDVRDAARIRQACRGVDVIIHAAAMKQVPACEYNPLEAVLTNVNGSMKVLNAAVDCGVKRVMNVSTDKAVKPVNLYGATKMVAEKLMISGNVYTGGRGTIISSVRYGNVLGSRGSVAHVFRDQIEKGLPITITHPDMTRFWITLPAVARFLLRCVEEMHGGEIFVPRMKSMSVVEMMKAMAAGKEPEYIITGVRQGEKLHEVLFAEEDYAYVFDNHYEVFSCIPERMRKYSESQFEFNSSNNPNGKLTRDELCNMLEEK